MVNGRMDARAKVPVILGFAVLLAVLLAAQVMLAYVAHEAFHRLQGHVETFFRGLEAIERWRGEVDAWAEARLSALLAGSGTGSETLPQPPESLEALGVSPQGKPDPRAMALWHEVQGRIEALQSLGAGGARTTPQDVQQRIRALRSALEALADYHLRRYASLGERGEAIYHAALLRQQLFVAAMLLVGALVAWWATRQVDVIEKRYQGEIQLRQEIEAELHGHRDPLEELVNERTMELSYQASHDSLTGLFNRYEFERRLEITLSLCRTARCVSCVLYLDLDRFKIINDTCGHMAGDELLRQLAGVLQRHVRKGDTLARLGGDEFGVILDGCDVDQAHEIAETIKEAVAGYRFVWHGGVYGVGVSIGVAVITPEEISRAEVLNRADSACYAAKEEGRNRVRVFTESDQEVERRRGEVRWINRVRSAMREGRLELFGQPIVPSRAAGAEPLSCEVLLRIQDEEGEGVFSPADFIPAAERYGLMGDLDRWVLDQAMAQYVALFGATASAQRPRMFVNISAHSVGDRDFAQWVKARIHAHGLPEGSVCLEITETAAVSNLNRAIQLMAALHEQGLLFALDDFGSGLTSFSYLRAMPLAFLKIEGEFVRDMIHDDVNVALVRAINDIGHVMGLKTVAEFVEDERLLRMVRHLGVDYCQGYVFAKPMPLAEAFALCVKPAAAFAKARA